MSTNCMPDSEQLEIFKEIGFPPPKDETIYIESETDENIELAIAEWAETYLGVNSFNALVGSIADIPGVTDVYQEDRELFIIKSTLNSAELAQAVWTIFLSLAETVHHQIHTS